MRCGAVEVDIERKEVWQDRVRLSVAPRVADVLAYLIKNPHRTISKEELFQQVWQGRPVEDGAISRVIWDVRAILGDQGKRLIVNVPRRGYRFEPEAFDELSPASTVAGAAADRAAFADVDSLQRSDAADVEAEPPAQELRNNPTSKAQPVVWLWLTSAALIGTLIWGVWSAHMPSRDLLVQDTGADSASQVALLALASLLNAAPVKTQALQRRASGESMLGVENAILKLYGDNGATLTDWVANSRLRKVSPDMPQSIAQLDFRAATETLRAKSQNGSLNLADLVWLALALAEQGNGHAAQLITRFFAEHRGLRQKLPDDLHCLIDDLYLESVATPQSDVEQRAQQAPMCPLAKARMQARLGQKIDVLPAAYQGNLVLRLRAWEFQARWQATRQAPEQALQALAQAEGQAQALNWLPAQARLAAAQGMTAKRMRDLVTATTHFQRAESLFRQLHMDTEAERIRLQLTLFKVGRALDESVFAQAESLRERGHQSGDRRAALFAQLVLAMREGADLDHLAKQVIPEMNRIADREEAFALLQSSLTVLRWRGRSDLVMQVMEQADGWFQTDSILALMMLLEQASEYGVTGDAERSADAFLRAEALADTPNLSLKQRAFYCVGSGALASVGKTELSALWVRQCYQQELSADLRCGQHYALATYINLPHLQPELMTQRLQQLSLDLAAKPDVNCLRAASNVALALAAHEWIRESENLYQAIKAAFPDPAIRNLRAPWLMLQWDRCWRRSQANCQTWLERVLETGDVDVAVYALDSALRRQCSDPHRSAAQAFLNRSGSQARLQAVKSGLARCDEQLSH